MDLSWLTHNYLTRGFWGDEAWTAGISRLPIPEIIKITSQDFHPPFYYFLVHYFGAPSGYAEVPVRLISLFFFVLTGIASFYFAKYIWSQASVQKQPAQTPPLVSGVGIYGLPFTVAILVLTSPILLTYAMEARSYALLAFESALSAYIFWQAKDECKGQYKWRIGYFLLGSVMVYTHYYAWFVLLSHATYLLLFDRKKILPLLPSALGIFLVQLPWLPTLLGQTKSAENSYWIGAINSRTHLEFFMRVVGGDIDSPWQKPLTWIVGLSILADLSYRIFKKNLPDTYKFLVTWLIVPTLIPTIVSMVLFPVFFYRYLIFSAIPILILLLLAAKDFLIKPWALVTFIAIIVYMQLRIDWKLFDQFPRSMREATAELYKSKTPGYGSVYTVLPSFAEVMYYTAPHDRIIVLPEGLVQFSGKSLLDAYVRLGYTSIEDTPNTDYWYLSPEKTVEHIAP